MESRVLILTGSPGVGKTTALLKVVETLHKQGYSVGGMISREARISGSRVGFQVEDLANGKKGWLARVGRGFGPRVGRYVVDIDDLERVGVAAISNAIANSDLVAVDEIGPMELASKKFRDAVQKALQSGKLVLAVVHQRADDNIIVEARNDSHSEVWKLTLENRNQLPVEIASKVLELLERCR